jgi:hypothetical protein
MGALFVFDSCLATSVLLFATIRIQQATMNKDLLTGFDTSGMMQHLVSRDPIKDQRDAAFRSTPSGTRTRNRSGRLINSAWPRCAFLSTKPTG